MISQFGDSVYVLVLIFMANKITENPIMVGLVAIMQAIPFVVLGPYAGTLADRIDRRAQMVGADFLSVVVTAGLGLYALLDPTPSVVPIMIAAFLLATAHTFFMPARSASIPALVPPSRVLEANGFAMASQQTIAMAGIGLSASALGVIYQLAPTLFFPVAVLLNCVTFAASAYFLIKLPEIRAVRIDESGPGPRKDRLRQVIQEASEGVRLVFRDPVTSVALPITAIGTIFVSGFMVVYVDANKKWYGGEFTPLAMIEFAFAASMVVTSLIVGRMNIRRVGLSFICAQIALGLMVVLMPMFRPYWSFLIINAACGIALPFLILPLNTYLQTAIADELRGRVNAAWTLVTQGLIPVGIGITAWLLTAGLETTFFVMGVGLAASGAAGFFSRKFVRSRLPDITRPESDEPDILGHVESGFAANFVENEGEILEPRAEVLKDGRF